MSRRYDPSSDYDNWWTLGSTVEFDHGNRRLRGTISRVYFGDPAEIHVEVDGVRYEVNINADNAEMIWD